MKKNNIKYILKLISEISIVLFFCLYIIEKFFVFTITNNIELKNIFVIIFLFTSYRYYKLELNDKNAEIKKLKSKLSKKDKIKH